MRSLVPKLALLPVFLGVLAGSTAADGQSNSSVAEALFNDGRALHDQRQFDEACPKFRESDRLEPAVGTKLNLALCEEARGHLATAWALFRVVTELLPAQDPRRAIALEHRLALDSRVPSVLIRLQPSAPVDTSVAVDDTLLAAASLGTPLPVDPGSHVLSARAPGHRDALISLELTEGQTLEVAVAPGPVLERAPVVAPPPASKHPSAPVRATALPPSAPDGPFTPLRIAAVSTAGAGVLSLVLGGVFAADALNRNEDSADLGCQDSRCPPAAKQARLAALAAADRATVFGIVGGALVAGGAVLWFVGAPQGGVNAGVAVQSNRLEARLFGVLPSLGSVAQ